MAKIAEFKGFTEADDSGVILEGISTDAHVAKFHIPKYVMTHYYYGDPDPVRNAEINRSELERACQEKARKMGFAQGLIEMNQDDDFIGLFKAQDPGRF